MNHLTRTTTLWILAMATTVAMAQAPTPTIAPNTPFALPLTDGKTTKAIVWVTPDLNTYLLYSVPGAAPTIWRLEREKPKPDPDPEPKPEPEPEPEPTHLQIAIVEDIDQTTPKQRAIIASPKWRQLALESHTLIGILPIDLIDPTTGQPPTQFAEWLHAAEQLSLPCLLLRSDSGQWVLQDPLPESGEALYKLILRYTEVKNATTRNHSRQRESTNRTTTPTATRGRCGRRCRLLPRRRTTTQPSRYNSVQ